MLKLKREQLVSALKGGNVADVVIEETIATMKIKRIRLVLNSGKELVLKASGIEDILVNANDGKSTRISELESEWAMINKKWHLYP